MPQWRYTIQITLHTPVLSQAIGSRAFGMDTAALRDENDRPALPGSLIRGNLRQAWKELAALDVPNTLDQDDIRLWLGEPSPDGTHDEPKRGLLRFADHWTAQETGQTTIRHRIQRDPDTGTVARGALQMVETPHPAGTVAFCGHVDAWLEDNNQAQRLQRWLDKGLSYVPALGALKGIGFGRLESARVEVDKLSPGIQDIPKLDPNGFGIRLQPDRPFCFARPKTGNNRFESQDFIPGGAIKGVIARYVNTPAGQREYPTLHDYLDKVRITHALPAPQEQTTRPVTPPLSLAVDKDDKLYDLARHEEPRLLNKSAPTFQPDWKDPSYQAADEHCGWGRRPGRRLRVHTAIDDETNTVKEGALFSVEAVDPKGYHWLADTDLSRVPEADRPQVARQLARLLSHGLDGLGKTKANARVTLSPERHPPHLDCDPPDTNGRLVMLLQSDARLSPSLPDLPPSNGDRALWRHYRDVFHVLSGQVLELSHYYAQQTLVGGDYLWTRFRRRAEPYNPELLTLAGSVFVFQVSDAKAAADLAQCWRQHGLPQHPDAPGGEDWRRTPYLATNGYGEVLIDLSLHRHLDPTQGG